MVHIAIIMDGNGRWAKQRGMPRMEGHKAGLRTFQTIAIHAARRGIEYLTVYAFSVQNWSRPVSEIKGLFHLAQECFSELDTFQAANIRLRLQGCTDLYPRAVQETIQTALQKTSQNTGLVLTVALSYGGREEIAAAAERLCATHTGSVSVQDFETALNPEGIPPPDLIVRTSGEFRVSNFLLWQSAYSEYWITETLWPDFTEADFDKALPLLAARDRRYGKVDTAPTWVQPSLDTTRQKWLNCVEEALQIQPGSYTELQKYVENAPLRAKYFELFQNAKQAGVAHSSPTLWAKLVPYLKNESAELQTQMKQWTDWLLFSSWIQTSHSISFSELRSFVSDVRDQTGPLDMFRFLKRRLKGPLATESEEQIKERLLDLTDQHRALYTQFLQNMGMDVVGFAHALVCCLWPFRSYFAQGSVSDTVLYDVVFLGVAILYPDTLPASPMAILELALRSFPTDIALLSKLKTGLVYFYLFSDKTSPPSGTTLVQYLDSILV